MEIANYLNKFALPRKNLTEEQFLAGEVYEYFGKELMFPRIMAIIRDKGKGFVREVFEEIRKGDPRNRLSLFVWRCKNCQVKWR